MKIRSLSKTLADILLSHLRHIRNLMATVRTSAFPFDGHIELFIDFLYCGLFTLTSITISRILSRIFFFRSSRQHDKCCFVCQPYS